MICLVCKIDRNSKDYYKSNICYKCLYIEKTNVTHKKEKTCKVCCEKLPHGRWVFCSDMCAEKNKYEDWTRSIKFPHKGEQNKLFSKK